MTQEEIKKICTEYADGLARCFPELKERNKYRDKVAQAGNVIRLIQRDYCIVPKEQLKELYACYKQHEAVCKEKGLYEAEMIARGSTATMRNIFGEVMFEEEGE